MAAATVPPLKIAVLHYQPSGEPDRPGGGARRPTPSPSWAHQPVTIGVHDRVFDLLKAIEDAQADLVFNVCETFADDYRLEVNVAALMEMARRPLHRLGHRRAACWRRTRSSPSSCSSTTRSSPPTSSPSTGRPSRPSGACPSRLIVKPARTDASIGIGQHSVVKDWDELTRRVRDIRKTLNDEALAEEFIDGREVYVGVIGTPTRPEILPIVELDWGAWDTAMPRVSDRRGEVRSDHRQSPHLVMARDIVARPSGPHRAQRTARLPGAQDPRLRPRRLPHLRARPASPSCSR